MKISVVSSLKHATATGVAYMFSLHMLYCILSQCKGVCEGMHIKTTSYLRDNTYMHVFL